MTKAKDELTKQLREELAELATSLQGDSYYSVLPDELGDEHIKPFLDIITAHTNAEIARTLDSLEAEFDRHAKSIGLWGMEGLMLDTLARTGNLSSEQKVERDAMVTERRALAILYGAIQAERAKLKEEK